MSRASPSVVTPRNRCSHFKCCIGAGAMLGSLAASLLVIKTSNAHPLLLVDQ